LICASHKRVTDRSRGVRERACGESLCAGRVT
jgi:hypothetical protein